MPKVKRPTCVTVIGRAWMVNACLMCAGACMGLYSSMQFEVPEGDAPFPIYSLLAGFRVFAGMQLGLSIYALYASVNFLNLKSWTRRVLELLTLAELVFCVGITLTWLGVWTFLNPSRGGIGLIGAIIALFNAMLVFAPLVIIYRYLRSDKVRSTFESVRVPPNSSE